MSLKDKLNRYMCEKAGMAALLSSSRERIMDNNIFDIIQDTVIIAGKEVESTAKRLSDKAKLAYEIRTRESYLNELYKELGKEYYTTHRDDEDEDFEEIETLLKELKDLRGRQQSL